MRNPRPILLLAAILIVSLVGCERSSVPAVTPTINPADVSTQVNKLLTEIPPQAQNPTTAVVIPILTSTSAPTKVIASATSIFTTTPKKSPTPLISPVATRTNTPAADDPRNTLGTPTRSDKFASGQQGWGGFSDSHVRVTLQTGYLELVALNADGWYSWSMSSPKLANFYIEMTAKTGDCKGLDTYGLMTRAPDFNQGYFYGFSCDGQFHFQKWDGTSFTEILKWKADPAILSGANQTNRMGMMAKGTHFTFFANGKQIGEADDSTYTDGLFGVYTSAVNTANFTTQISEIDYWNQP